MQGMRINTSRGHLPLLCSRQHLNFARIPESQEQSVIVNAFLICRDTLPTTFPQQTVFIQATYFK